MPAIKVEGLGKSYLVGHNAARAERYTALRDVMARNVHDLARKTRDMIHGRPIIQGDEVEEFWALKDVSFEVEQGETLGIIGRNGAGKSTLLKVLSRITEPTKGRITLQGRVASLLEVGTGFHPELTGRENIFLNGAILGMTRREIQRKFDEIVAFAEVEQFLDTPVKRYSSGMYVRLAFAVAAHLEPEILVVDEVLAVGDAAFQKKCLGKMGAVAKEGRTILFVSHNMGAISNLTERALVLDNGALLRDVTTTDAISLYLLSGYASQTMWQAERQTEHPIQILSIGILNDHDQLAADLDVTKDFSIKISYRIRQPIRNSVIAVNIHAADGTHLVSLEDIDSNPELLMSRLPGLFQTQVCVPGNWLNNGSYLLRVGSGIPGRESFDNIEALRFTLVETGETTKRGHRGGYLLPMLSWQTEAINNG